MSFIAAVRIGRHSAKFAIKILLLVLLVQTAGALLSNAAEARAQHYFGARTAHAAVRHPVHYVARRPAHFAARRVARVSYRSRSWAAVRAVRRQPAFAASRAYRGTWSPPHASGSVIAEAMRYVGAGNVTGMRGAWCADYASMVLRHTGRRPLANRMASSALAYAPRVSQPRPGDLVVLNTRGGYAQHVGFFAGWDHGRVVMVSGNWGHRVSRASVFRGAVAAFVRV